MVFKQKTTDVYPLTHGTLTIEAHGGEAGFSELSAVGSRINPQRQYIFISKINGKYYPVKPQVINHYQHKLLGLIKPVLASDAAVLVVGLAETATLMGVHLAELLQRQWQHKVSVFHTTRYKLKDADYLEVHEAHSHAKSHHLYINNHDLGQYQNLVLIDDEITTGNTLEMVTRVMADQAHAINKVIWVSYLSWISQARQNQIKGLFGQLDIEFINLFYGEVDYQSTSSEILELPNNVTSGVIAHNNPGYQLRYPTSAGELPEYRFIDQQGNELVATDFSRERSYAVIGTSEFTFYPFKFAEDLEACDLDVVFQSTGRSPIDVSGPITKREVYFDRYYGGELNLYNRCDTRVPVFLFETLEQANACTLAHEQQAIIGYLAAL